MQLLHSETGLCQNKIGLLFDHQHFGAGGGQRVGRSKIRSVFMSVLLCGTVDDS